MMGYKTIADTAIAEHVEKRSRFISLAAPVRDEYEAGTLLSEIRSRHWDASHNCYSYILRAGGIRRYSDDGEPQGTAGMPILEVLSRRKLEDVIVVVTRYFGGTLLGAGGLARAYTMGATLALNASVVLNMQPCVVFSLEFGYQIYGKLQSILSAFGVQVLDDEFSELVRLRLRIRAAEFSAFQKELSELTSGSASPLVLGEEFAPV